MTLEPLPLGPPHWLWSNLHWLGVVPIDVTSRPTGLGTWSANRVPPSITLGFARCGLGILPFSFRLWVTGLHLPSCWLKPGPIDFEHTPQTCVWAPLVDNLQTNRPAHMACESNPCVHYLGLVLFGLVMRPFHSGCGSLTCTIHLVSLTLGPLPLGPPH